MASVGLFVLLSMLHNSLFALTNLVFQTIDMAKSRVKQFNNKDFSIQGFCSQQVKRDPIFKITLFVHMSVGQSDTVIIRQSKFSQMIVFLLPL